VIQRWSIGGTFLGIGAVLLFSAFRADKPSQIWLAIVGSALIAAGCWLAFGGKK